MPPRCLSILENTLSSDLATVAATDLDSERNTIATIAKIVGTL